MIRAYQQGFSLLELMLVSALGALLSLVMVGVFSYPLITLEHQQQSLRERHYLMMHSMWLIAELHRAIAEGQVIWQFEENCLLYAPLAGVRIEHGAMQWRGGERSCNDGYWQSLTDPRQLVFTAIEITVQAHTWQVNVSAQSAQQPSRQWQWHYQSAMAIQLDE